MATGTFLVGSDNLLQVAGLLNALTTTYLNAANLTAVVTDYDTGASIYAATTMPATTTATGTYQCTLSSTGPAVAGQRLLATITASDVGTGLKRIFQYVMQAENG